nr:immunoglobulin heavy chain junction region [Macaca mulatta]
CARAFNSGWYGYFDYW